MSNTSAPLLVTGLSVNASRLLVTFLCINHSVALIVIYLLKFAWWINASLLIIILLHLYYVLTLQALKTASNAIQRLYKKPDEIWSLYNKKGNEVRGSLKGNSLNTRFLLILNFKIEQQYLPVSVVVLKDALSKKAFRDLRLSI